ncbi:MAG: transglycosylase domain-containing protein [Balneolaceae bacterium]|nr:transglycosylase domain-containing protein [Balneolaceae bacterium]
MSSSKREPIDQHRYFNDPEYRSKILAERDAAEPTGGNGNKKKPSSDYNLTKAIFKYTGIFLLLCFVGASGYIYFLFQGLPSIEQLENPDTAIATEVRSRDGVVLDKYFTENRTWVRFDDISPHAIDALVATEDHRFFNHWGMDMVRTLAIPYHLMMGRRQGGSTISQQLARNLYKEIGQAFSVSRKFREMITAVQIEKNYTKREIIEMYLNTVEYSNSAFGIEAAARTHYNKSAAELNVTEAATLVGSVNAVYAYNPRLFPERSKQRRDIVLTLMNRQGFIDANTMAALKSEPIKLDYQPPSKAGRVSRYFGEYVRQNVTEWAEENGYDIYTDGLVIHTTIDSRLQKHAELAVRTKLDSLQKIFESEWTSRNSGMYMDRLWEEFPTFKDSFLEDTDEYKNGFQKYDTNIRKVVLDSLKADSMFVDSVMKSRTRLEAGFVAVDPTNGNILAWVGGSNYGNVQFDHVYQSRRQAGSTFKPFVYAVAIDNGYKPYHKFSKYPTKFYDRNGNVWAPKDQTVGSGPIMVSLREALARSMNNVTVRLLPEIAGAPDTNELWRLDPAARKIKEMASNLGIDMLGSPAYPSIALGTAEVSLLEITSAYTTFANQGVHIDPIAITRIEDREGNVLVEYHPDYRQEVISPETAYIMTDMMRGVIRGGEGYNGTGVRLRNVYGVRQDIAGKTGTTQNSADNWFIAMTPHIVMGSWVGGEDRRIRFPTDLNYSIGQGARTALPIVGEFINMVTADPDAYWAYDSFTPPPGFIMPEDPEEARNEMLRDNERGRIGW